MTSLAAIDTASLLAGVWSACDLTYLLHEGQVEIRDTVRESGDIIDVILAARRYGKSWYACVESVEEAIECDKLGLAERFVIAAQTQVDAEGIFVPHMEEILRDCPTKLRPAFNGQKLRWTWPSGTRIQLAGTDGKNRDRLRGRGARRVRVDEAGFHDDFEYLIRSVLLPQCLKSRSDATRREEPPSLRRFGLPGKLLMLSTPSRTPDHPFVAKYCLEAEEAGKLRVKTIYDAPHISREAADAFIAESGGLDSTDVRREYFCERVVDEARAIVPEFWRHRADIVADIDAPDFFRCYTVADFGYNDLTVVGFLEHHFRDDLLYQRDELVFRNTGSHIIAPAVAEREFALWGKAPDHRYGDPNASKSHGEESEITLGDLAELHGQTWAPVRRDKLTAGVNALRVAIAGGRRAWHPRCVTTIAHLSGGVWNAHRTSFDRSGEHGHFDAVAMSVYSEREIDRTRNPYPAHGFRGRDDAFIRHDKIEEHNHGAVSAWLGGGRRR